MTALVVFTSLITIMPSLGVTRALGIGKREGASAVVEGIPLGLAAGVGSLTGSSFAAGVAAGWGTGFARWGGGAPAGGGGGCAGGLFVWCGSGCRLGNGFSLLGRGTAGLGKCCETNE